MEPTPQKTQSPAIPIAIVIAGGLIAAAVYFSGAAAPSGPQAVGTDTPTGAEQQAQEPELRPVDETDHIRGNPNAPILLVEYSDFDCPFCKQFHDTLNRIMEEYGTDGKVAWVYRQLPLEGLHPNAPKIAEASECVAELAGNEAFWTFSDLVFGERSTNQPTDITRLSEFAQTAGADVGEFESCLDSGKYADKVAESIQEAVAANGGSSRLGTPFTPVVVGGEYVGPISGAQPYEVIKQNIDTILSQIEPSE